MKLSKSYDPGQRKHLRWVVTWVRKNIFQGFMFIQGQQQLIKESSQKDRSCGSMVMDCSFDITKRGQEKQLRTNGSWVKGVLATRARQVEAIISWSLTTLNRFAYCSDGSSMVHIVLLHLFPKSARSHTFKVTFRKKDRSEGTSLVWTASTWKEYRTLTLIFHSVTTP